MRNNLETAMQNKKLTTKQKMHILQPKHTRLGEQEATEILEKLNISVGQLPRILSSDAALPEGCVTGDVIKIERKSGDEVNIYFRAVV